MPVCGEPESRWWLERRLQRRLRRGRVSKEEWLDICIRQHRWFMKWVWTPFVLLWLALAGWKIVAGITG
jgi:hypothetical protein